MNVPIRHVLEFIKAEPEDKTGDRSIGVVYQNTSVRPILVIVSCKVTVNAGAASGAVVYGRLGSSLPITEDATKFGYTSAPGNGSITGAIIILVPTEWYYKVAGQTSLGNQVAIEEWWEVTL